MQVKKTDEELERDALRNGEERGRRCGGRESESAGEREDGGEERL